MFKRGHYGKLLTSLWLFFLVIFFLNDATALTFPYNGPRFSIFSKVDTLIKKDNPTPADTLAKSDTLKSRTTVKDSTGQALKLEYDLVRHADDSIVQDLKNKKVYLYGNAEITYGDIDLKAAYIEVDFNNNTVFAKGMPDSTGKVKGVPEFKQGAEVFDAQTIKYDFVTKKGIIHDVTTKQSEGFLHGKMVKRMPDNSINVKNGEFTTCDLPDPHYAFKFYKARVIPGKLIITGPVYMEVEGIPLPIALPFGIFPNNPKRTSGLILPSYGESTSQGFYLMGGGYFWNINDKMTLKITGNIYTGGSWAISPIFTYKNRYKYSGNFSLGLAQNIISTKGSPDYQNSHDYHIQWSHRQDPKARPNSTFSASVNIYSSNYVKYTAVNADTYLSNTFSSSISYQRNWGNNVQLTAASTYTQNTQSHSVQLALPNINLNVNTFYPFQKQNSIKKGFLDGLSVSYNMQLENTINSTDSTLFTSQSLQKMQNGIMQQIPISLPLKVLKYFTLSNSININDRIYTSSIRRRWVNDTTSNPRGLPGQVVTDTIPGFNNEMDFTLSSSLSTKIYGMVKFKKGPIRAIRHVITPSVGFSYIPDFSTSFWGYAGHYTDYSDTTNYPHGRYVTYSRYESYLFGAPGLRKQGNITFAISNNLEIKVPSKKDTITGLKKIPLIENFTISGSYNLAADSVRMSNISLSGRTTLWKGLTIQYNGVLDPYATDSLGRDINKTYWQTNHRLFRWKNSAWNLSFNYQLSQDSFHKGKKKSQPTQTPNADSTDIAGLPGQNPMGIQVPGAQQLDWKVPWSLNLNYQFTYSNIKNFEQGLWATNKTLIQTLGFNGQVSLTPNWKFSFNSGWDFTNHQLSFTSVNIYRNLHCWEMSFSWIPIGPRKSWNFTLQIKAGMLKDFKLTKQKSFLESY
ncbi:MAG: LPS-assembly protein LptD [Bacteroidales bacterium]|nr:LPS-assembly protein LptD [Bacteroidales bacterium]